MKYETGLAGKVFSNWKAFVPEYFFNMRVAERCNYEFTAAK